MDEDRPAPHAGDFQIDNRHNAHSGFVSLDALTVTYRSLSGEMATITREVHDHGNGVAVLPVDAARRMVLLARQLRVPVALQEPSGWIVEACAGLIDADDDDPVETAKREAIEELGYRIHDLKEVAAAYSSPGTLTEKMHLYLASYGPDDRIGDGGGLIHESEDIEVLEWSIPDAWHHVATEGLSDAKTLILLQALRIAQPELFEDTDR